MAVIRGVSIDQSRIHGTATLSKVVISLKRHYRKKTGLLVYALDSNRLCVWLIDAKLGIRAYSVVETDTEDLAGEIQFLRRELNVANLQRGRIPVRRSKKERNLPLPKSPFEGRQHFDPNATKFSLQELTNRVLPPEIAQALPGYRQLIIVPTGLVGIIPFAALMPFEDGRYLIDVSSLSFAASIADVANARRRRAPYQSAVIVGNPDYPQHKQWIFPPLPGAKREANAVYELWRNKLSVQLFTGIKATSENVLRASDLSGDVLYLATHGVTGLANVLDDSFLVFSDGFLTAREIQHEKRLRRVRLAVLSACQTGLGRAHQGGVIGLARAFRLAGVRDVIMSLWSVDDDATAMLMTAFSANLESMDPADALRAAIIHTRDRYPDPVRWAPFMVFGNGAGRK